MRVLALFSAYGGATAGLVEDGAILAQDTIAQEHGLAAALSGMVHALLARTGAKPDMIAVIAGPGSFTGLRAGLALAHGLAIGQGIPAIAVTTGEALQASAPPTIGSRQLITAIVARRGRIFIEIGSATHSIPDDAYPTDVIPPQQTSVAICGNAANTLAATLAARGHDVMLTALRTPTPAAIAAVALRRLHGGLPALALLPLYVDAPEAKLPRTAPHPEPAQTA